MTRLTRLRLTQFRNYDALDLKLSGRHVCLFGANGAGKTNLIEAISQFSPGRGLRSAAIGELARAGHNSRPGTGWTVAAELLPTGETEPHRIGVAMEASASGAKRLHRLDGTNASAAEIAELVRVVWMTPAMDRVFAGGAGDRRRFFDRQVMAHIPAHGPLSAAYEKAMRERNALLEKGLPDPAWLSAVEGRMAEAGAEIMSNRTLIRARMQEALNLRAEDAFPKADLSLSDDASVTADALATRWSEMRRTDAKAGRTLTGPHRTDLTVIHRPTGLPAAQCSTGQQKALLIGLILASAAALSARIDGPAPLLLLDEAAAHLDADRRAALFDALDELGGQAWLTGTDRNLFDAFGERAERIEIDAGSIRSDTA